MNNEWWVNRVFIKISLKTMKRSTSKIFTFTYFAQNKIFFILWNNLITDSSQRMHSMTRHSPWRRLIVIFIDREKICEKVLTRFKKKLYRVSCLRNCDIYLISRWLAWNRSPKCIFVWFIKHTDTFITYIIYSLEDGL